MSVGTITGAVLALFVAAAVVLYLRGRAAPAPAVGRVLRWVALAGAVGVALAALPVAVRDGGGAVPYLLVPVPACALAVVADAVGRFVVTTTAAAALLVLGWGVFLAMFITPYFVFPALVLGAAAIASVRPRRERAVRDGAHP
ncbi:hypothetical protein [Saccharothrix sp. Mg75]|uniref:hypothetical protein n=1 Tax=Saccharothrix sp. Mg75 TaxID=3445357 RepID=UPI003EEB75F5